MPCKIIFYLNLSSIFARCLFSPLLNYVHTEMVFSDNCEPSCPYIQTHKHTHTSHVQHIPQGSTTTPMSAWNYGTFLKTRKNLTLVTHDLTFYLAQPLQEQSIFWISTSMWFVSRRRREPSHHLSQTGAWGNPVSYHPSIPYIHTYIVLLNSSCRDV